MKRAILVFSTLLIHLCVFGTGEPSTYFNIYVPPNNDAVQRNVALIVTAIRDSTSFEIIDDDADGDNDDSKTGLLMSGQSYILYIKDNGINDDARYASGGILKRDGDYFTIQSNKLVYASVSTDSDWQHDWVPGVDKKSVSNRFLVYAPEISGSNRDLNAFAYEDSCTVSIWKISFQSTTQSGYTNINWSTKTLVAQRTINRGEDLIYYYSDGRNIMSTGHTYLIESNKPISLQYGALYQNERDGGGQVPAANGSSAGELFYFAVPYQASGEQEIRIVSWDPANQVELSRYHQGQWIPMNSYTLNRLESGEWVGKANGNVSYQTVFRITCTPGKRVSVLEANWLETGSPGTSDIASMLSSETGGSSGKDFLAYVPPPGNQSNMIDPFTGNPLGGRFSHLYLFASVDSAQVEVVDAKTNGNVFNKTFTIAPHRYVDCQIDLNEWKSIYNGTGSPSGPDRPYLIVRSDKNISVLNANFNDNWMMYFGSSLEQSFTQKSSSDQSTAIPGDTLSVQSKVQNTGTGTMENPQVTVDLSSGLIPINSTLNLNQGTRIDTATLKTDSTGSSFTYENLSDLQSGDSLDITTTFIVSSNYNDGEPVKENTVLSTTTTVTANIGGQIQESTSSVAFNNNISDESQLLFSNCQTNTFSNAPFDSWNNSWSDPDGNGWDDLMISTKSANQFGISYKNTSGTLSAKPLEYPAKIKGKNVATLFADLDNDGDEDALVVHATGRRPILLENIAGNFQEVFESGVTEDPHYFHGAAFVDVNQDGLLDILITNFFASRFHFLYINKGDLKFEKSEGKDLTQLSNRSMAPFVSDYNNDGIPDLFIPNGNNENNALLKGLGNGQFELVSNNPISTHQDNSVGGAWGDYDNDGDQDLFVCNASGQNNRLYRNEGNGQFTSMDSAAVTQDGGNSHGAVWADVDNDGDLDLFVTNDIGPNFLYINHQNSFVRKMDESLVGDFGPAMGVSYSDYNRDGALDLMVSTHGENDNRLFCGAGYKNNQWLNIRLHAKHGNFTAIGAKVKCKSNGIWQYREQYPYTGTGSQNSSVLHFGLEQSTTVDSLIIHWPSGNLQVLTNLLSNQNLTIQEQDANRVMVYTYHDLNQNCLRDQNEPLVSNQMILIEEVGRFASNTAGNEIQLPQGSYNYEVLSNTYWSSACSGTLNLTGNQQDTVIYIGVISSSTAYDLSVNFGTTAWRKGFTNQTNVVVSNRGVSTAYDLVLNLNYPNPVSVVQTNKSFSDDHPTYSWLVDSLPSNGEWEIQILDSVGLNVNTGSELTLIAEVQANGQDADTSNNVYQEQIEVVGALDPNDLLSWPLAHGPGQFIDQDQEITYMVRFQNVGTWWASHVSLSIDLDQDLKASDMQFIQASHDHTWSITESGKIRVEFRNIQLPDSGRNEAASHGFFKFKVRPKSDAPKGAQIKTRALIQFDYEDPIATNELIHLIKYEKAIVSNQLHIYPNPGHLSVTLSLSKEYFKYAEAPFIKQVMIYSSTGELIEQYQITGRTFRLNTQDLPDGIYFIHCEDDHGSPYRGKLVIRH